MPVVPDEGEDLWRWLENVMQDIQGAEPSHQEVWGRSHHQGVWQSHHQLVWECSLIRSYGESCIQEDRGIKPSQLYQT